MRQGHTGFIMAICTISIVLSLGFGFRKEENSNN